MNAKKGAFTLESFKKNPLVKRYCRKPDAFGNVVDESERRAIDKIFPEVVRAIRQANFDAEIKGKTLICTDKILVGSLEGSGDDDYSLCVSCQMLKAGESPKSDPEYTEFVETTFPKDWRKFLGDLEDFPRAKIVEVRIDGEQFVLFVIFEEKKWNRLLRPDGGPVVLPAFSFPHGELTKVSLKNGKIKWEWRMPKDDYLVMREGETALRREEKDMFEGVYELAK